jgi:hypothetical protein
VRSAKVQLVVAWSWPGRGLVVAWSWLGRGLVVAWSWPGQAGQKVY